MTLRPNGKHYVPVSGFDDDALEPRRLRPTLRNHPVDDMDFGEFLEFENNYSGNVGGLIEGNLDTLSSYLDELEDIDDIGLPIAKTRPVAKFRRKAPNEIKKNK